MPFFETDSVTLYQGDSLKILRDIPGGSVDAVVTDPPYSSGGNSLGEISRKPSDKYVVTGTKVKHPEFFGDNRGPRAYLIWSTLWMAECARIVKPGGYLLCFSDWRQLPVVSDAIQVAGWSWKGIVPWDKTEGTRPQMGWFRAQCEYVLTASRGSLGQEQARAVRRCLPGIFRENVRASEKRHMTGKPVPLMKRLLEVLPGGATILDPFAGGGTTLVAAREMGMRSIGIEMSGEYCQIIKDRLNEPRENPA